MVYTIMARDSSQGADSPSRPYAVAHTPEEALKFIKQARDERLVAMSFPPIDERLA